MTKFILHGGFTKEDNEQNHSFFTEFLEDIPGGGTALFVYFAARKEEEIPEKFKIHVEMCKKLSTGRKITFKKATEENFLEEIKGSDAIFLNGGSTNKLLSILKKYPDLGPLLERKTVAGSSAGAYVLATFGASHSEEVVREGLGITPLRVICHSESPKLPPSMASVAMLAKTAQHLELVTLKDYEWKVFRY